MQCSSESCRHWDTYMEGIAFTLLSSSGQFSKLLAGLVFLCLSDCYAITMATATGIWELRRLMGRSRSTLIKFTFCVTITAFVSPVDCRSYKIEYKVIMSWIVKRKNGIFFLEQSFMNTSPQVLGLHHTDWQLHYTLNLSCSSIMHTEQLIISSSIWMICTPTMACLCIWLFYWRMWSWCESLTCDELLHLVKVIGCSQSSTYIQA